MWKLNDGMVSGDEKHAFYHKNTLAKQKAHSEVEQSRRKQSDLGKEADYGLTVGATTNCGAYHGQDMVSLTQWFSLVYPTASSSKFVNYGIDHVISM